MFGSLAVAALLGAFSAAAQDPAILHLRVIEGEGTVYPIGSRATRGITVQVTDETGKPVENAAVTFRLPAEGPTGAFSTGERIAVVATAADGTAVVWGMQWNRTPGPFEVRITAAKSGATAGTVCTLYLTDALISSAPPAESSGSRLGGRAKLWILVGLVGAAAVGVAVAGGGGAAAAAAPSTGGPQIGPPAITIGRP
jgi:hypothetical protein